MTFPPRPRAWACRVWLPGSLTPRGVPLDLAAAPAPAFLRLREVLGLPGGRRPRDLWLRIGEGRPHTRCPESVPQVPCQAGQGHCFATSVCRHVGQHSALTAGPLPRQAPTLVVALVFVVGAPALLPGPPWAPRAAVGSAVQAVRLHRSSVVLPLGRGLPPRAAARVGFPGPRAVGRPPGRQCVPGPGQGPGRGLGDREMTALPAAPAARLVGRGAAGAPVRRASWPVGPPCRTLPDPGGLGPFWGRGVWGCTVSEGRAAVVSVGVAVCACVGGASGGVYAGSAAGRSGVPWCGRGSGWACVAAAWLAAGHGPCAGATGGVRGCGLLVGLGAGSLCGCALPKGCSGWVPTAPVFVGLGMAPLPAGDARCPRIPVAVWCCVGCRCPACLDARSCRGLCAVPALDGAGSPVVRVLSVARCWCGAATGVGGAEVDGLGEVEDVAADVRARTFVALVAVVVRDRGGRVVMVAVGRRGE